MVKAFILTVKFVASCLFWFVWLISWVLFFSPPRGDFIGWSGFFWDVFHGNIFGNILYNWVYSVAPFIVVITYLLPSTTDSGKKYSIRTFPFLEFFVFALPSVVYIWYLVYIIWYTY